MIKARFYKVLLKIEDWLAKHVDSSATARIRRYTAVVILGLACIWGVSLVVIIFFPGQYRTYWSLVLPSSENNASISLTDVGEAINTNKASFDTKAVDVRATYRMLLQSQPLLERAAVLAGAKIKRLPVPTIKLVDLSAAIELRTQGDSPEEAQQRANAITQALLEKVSSLREEEVRLKERVNQTVLASAQAQLFEAQKRYVVFKSTRRALSQRQMDELGLMAIENRKSRIYKEAAIQHDQAELSSLTRQLGLSNEEAVLTTLLQSDSMFSSIYLKRMDTLNKLTELTNTREEMHPDVKEARRLLNIQEAQLLNRAQQIKPGITTAQIHKTLLVLQRTAQDNIIPNLILLISRIEANQAELKTLNEQFKNLDTQLSVLAEDSATLDNMERRVKFAEVVYSNALWQSVSLKAGNFNFYPLIQILEPPDKADIFDRPRFLFVILGASTSTVLLLIALGLAWIRDKSHGQDQANSSY